ncbi:hypothetical protein ARMGADRAFT_1130294 [Armillaria gallica]|uniref:Uncharacterized protein n=1 Tax=Armillaria gallica TaxID=47427 RepID=A0A2H3DST6_ARMGA|nr:hypothetical protein ARMGADRAFT_1130294 [Armillaria gallica]
MSCYALHSCCNTVATGPALPRVDSPLSELSEPSTASAQDSAPGPAMEEVTDTSAVSSSDSEDDEIVGPQGNLTATNISKKNLSRSNVEDEVDSDTSSSSMESEKASSKTDAEEPTNVQPAWPVRLHRTQSLDDLSKPTVHFKEQQKARKLTKEQASMVRAAEYNLTAEQHEILAKCQDKITWEQTQNPPETPNATPGPSFYIAKRNFVNCNQEVDDSELDIEAQHEVLNNWNQVHDEIQKSLNGDQVGSKIDNDGFTAVRKSSKQTKASSKSKTSWPKKMVGKTSCYDSLEVEQTSDEDPEDPE